MRLGAVPADRNRTVPHRCQREAAGAVIEEQFTALSDTNHGLPLQLDLHRGAGVETAIGIKVAIIIINTPIKII